MAGIGGGQSMVVGRGLVEILPDFRKWGKQLATDMRTARTQLDGSASGMRASAATVGKSMAMIGKGTSLVFLGVAAGATKMAADFQSETAVLQTAAGESAKGLKTVRKGILDISAGTGTGIKNLTDGMYTIEKAGFRGSQGLMVLKAAAQGAREENAKLSDVTNAMTSVMMSYHLRATDSVRVMNALKTAAGEGKITMEEFSGAMSSVLPIASANKIGLAQVAGSVATLTQHGTSAREATMELAATIRALAKPNNVASREMARFGLSSVDVSLRLKDVAKGGRGLSGTFNLLSETILRKMGPSGKILMSAFEGTKQSAHDAQIMLSKMPPELRKQAEGFQSGKMTMQEWAGVIKGSTTTQAPMLKNFASLVSRSKGFSRELKNGGPAAKTYTDALGKMAGGAIGLNTILQLTGENTTSNAERIKRVGKSYTDTSKDVEGWKVTQGLLNVQLSRAKQQFQVIGIEIGSKLIPVISAATGFFVAHKEIMYVLVGVILTFITVTTAAFVATKLYAAGSMIASAASGIATAAQWLWNAATGSGTGLLIGLRIQLAALWVWQKLQAIATGVATAAQWLWNAAMTANPIGLVIAAIALLVGAIIYIALKTTWFQTIWKYTWNFIKQVSSDVGRWFSGPFVNFFTSVWGAIQRGFINPIVHFFSVVIPNAASGMWHGVMSFVRAMVLGILDSFGSIIHGAAKLFGWVPGVGGKLKAASRAFDNFRDDVNKALGGVNGKTVAVKVAFGATNSAGFTNIGGIARASGGPIFGPGTSTSDSVPLMASTGEHVLSAREVTGLGGHGAVSNMRAMARSGQFGFAIGGGVNVRPSAAGAGFIDSNVTKAVVGLARASAQSLYNSIAPTIGAIGGIGGGVKRWTATVQGVLRILNLSTAWTATVLRRMNQESGGNPTAVNRTDSNWKAGHPSVGLMQVIRGTFQTYAGRYRGTGPFMYGVSVNPSANIFAGVNYANHRYGSLSALNRPGGYDSGGLMRGMGAWMKYTNSPERVLSPRQTAAFDRLVGVISHPRAAAAGGGGGIHIEHLHVDAGVIGSQHELENWFMRTTVSLKKKGRLK